MPLLPCHPRTGDTLPRSEWSAGDRASYVRQVCTEQRINPEVGRPIDLAALADAEKLAGSDPELVNLVKDVRTLTASLSAGAPAGRNRATTG